LEESTTIQYVLDLDLRSFPPRLRDVEDTANKLLAERDTPPVGRHWASNFIKPQPEFKTRRFRIYDYIIAKYGIVESGVANRPSDRSSSNRRPTIGKSHQTDRPELPVGLGGF
jgi:hypothetical protein